MGNPSPRSAYQEALRMLSRRALTRGELVQRLQDKGHPSEEAGEAAQRVSREGYQDDEAVARRMAERFRIEKSYGRRRARREMLRRRLEESMVEAVLNRQEEVDPALEDRALGVSLDRWVDRNGKPEGDRDLARLVGHLRRRGFAEPMIRSALLDG